MKSCSENPKLCKYVKKRKPKIVTIPMLFFLSFFFWNIEESENGNQLGCSCFSACIVGKNETLSIFHRYQIKRCGKYSPEKERSLSLTLSIYIIIYSSEINMARTIRHGFMSVLIIYEKYKLRGPSSHQKKQWLLSFQMQHLLLNVCISSKVNFSPRHKLGAIRSISLFELDKSEHLSF